MLDKLVTVFGGGGFVGRYVVQAIMRAGGRVRVAQRDPRGAYFLKPQGGLGQFQVLAADITRPDTIARAVDGADMTVNLVGVMGKRMSAVHADGAEAIARAAAAAGHEALVHVSAIGADRDSPSVYGRSKGEGEARVLAAFPGAAILRPSVIFGREDDFINRFARLIMTATALPIPAPVPVVRPGVRFQPVYVADVADAAALALASPAKYAGRAFELGGPDHYTMDQLLRWIAGTIGRSPSFLPLPDAVSAILARLPGGPLSWDQWLMLQKDNVAAPSSEGLGSFGITPTALGAVAPGYLVRFRKAGRFGARAAAEA
jgi:uncharacterized protein YbjT (DUF2867 family)